MVTKAELIFTGKPCKRGHIAPRRAANHMCIECAKMHARHYWATQPEKQKTAKNKWAKTHRAEIAAQVRQWTARKRALDPAWAKKQLEYHNLWRQKRKESIAGRPRPMACELCGTVGKTVFDHCHATGRFRGWLCDRCNLVLGHVDDSPAFVLKLLDYLMNHQKLGVVA